MAVDFTFVVAGRTLTHNTLTWSSRTNRHPTTGGRAWGWIEGAPGNVCWSNDPVDIGETFKDRDAAEAVRVHNDWLEQQRPLSFRYIECTQAYESECTKGDMLRVQLQEHTLRLQQLQEKLSSLEEELNRSKQL